MYVNIDGGYLQKMNWGLVAAGLIAVAVVTIVGILLAAAGNGVWLVAYLPLAATAGGAVLLAGRESS